MKGYKMEDKYPRAYKEVIEVLKFVPVESVNKIPKEMLKMFKNKMDKNYNFSVDINKNFEEQILLEETKAILANIFRDYWASPQEKEKIIAKEKLEIQRIEKEKLQKYNPDNLFKKKAVVSNSVENTTNLPAEIKKEYFYKKILKFFRNIFHID